MQNLRALFAVPAALVLLTLFPGGGAFAHQLSTEECRGFANDSLRIAIKRDQGMQWPEAERALLAASAQVLGKRDSYIKDGDDRDMLLSAAKQIFQVQESPGRIYDITFNVCNRRYMDKGGT